MGSPKQKKAVVPLLPPDDLEAVVKEAVFARPGVTSATGAKGIKKALPASYQAFEGQAKALLQALASRGEVHSFSRGKTMHFFPREPLAVLDERVFERLGTKLASKEELKALAMGLAPGFDVALDDWLKRRLAEKRLFEHAGTGTKKQKRYGTTPDVRKALGATLTALKKALKVTDAQGISREALAQLLLDELGVEPPRGTASVPEQTAPVRDDAAQREQFLMALRALGGERPREALLSVRELRARLPLSKPEFDALALALSREGSVSLHHHDHPHALSEDDRHLLVQDARGNYYIGIAPGRGN